MSSNNIVRKAAVLGSTMLLAAFSSWGAALNIDYTLVQGVPGADATVPFGINADGDISGTSFVGGFSGSVGFLWHKATNSFTLIDLGSVQYNDGRGLNDSGIVVGDYAASSLSPPDLFGFIYDSTTGGVTSNASALWRGVSNDGDLAGLTPTQPDGTVLAVRNFQGHVETFSCFGSPGTVAEGVNTSGDVVGVYNFPGFVGAFLYHDGACIDISIPGAVRTDAWGINDRGDVVGDYVIPGPQCFFGAFYRHDGQVDVTRIPASCGKVSNGKFLFVPPVTNVGAITALFSINNDRIVTGTINSPNLNAQMFYGSIRGASK